MKLHRKSLSTYIKMQDILFDKLLDIYKMQNAQLREIIRKKDEGVHESHANDHFNYLVELQKAIHSLQKQLEKANSFAAMIEEGGELAINTGSNPLLRDAALIMSAHIINENELMVYNALIEIALKNGHNNVYNLLKQTLEEDLLNS